MKNMKILAGLCIIMSLSFKSFASAEIPDSVKKAKKSISTFINELKNNVESEIIRKLGKPSEKSTWDFNGAKSPLLHFITPAGAKISVYFYQNKAVTISYLLISASK